MTHSLSRRLGLTAWALTAWLASSLALAAVEPAWTQADVDRDGTPERIATTNLVDIAFNTRGDIVGWYVKAVKGSGVGDYARAPSIVSAPSALIELSGTPTASAPQTRVVNEVGQGPVLEGSFSYTQGGATVQRVYRVHPRRLTVDLAVRVSGVESYRMSFTGLSDRPTIKALEVGASAPLSAGTVRQGRYGSLQCCNSALGNPGQALVIQPATPVPIEVGAYRQPRATDRGQETLERGRIVLTLPGGQRNEIEVYGGQNELVRLTLEGAADLPGLFEPNLFGRLSVLLISFMQSLRTLTGDWGLAIILLTLIIRVLIWPLLQTQLRSSAEMQALAPRIKEINEKFKDKPEKRAEATMALYKEHGVNPALGCLPALVQMPVLIVLWRVIANFEFDQGFLWLGDLSLPDPLYILPALYVGANILQTYLATMGNRDFFRQQLLIQVVFVYIVLSFPSGVTLYWVLSTLLASGQQLLINRSVRRRMGAAARA